MNKPKPMFIREQYPDGCTPQQASYIAVRNRARKYFNCADRCHFAGFRLLHTLPETELKEFSWLAGRPRKEA